nr:MAG TPA: hypothetical protein [Crassvirales sp.]
MAEIQVVLFNLNQDYMNKKSIKLNSANIISIRKNLDVTINKYWKIIRAENLMSKKAVAAKQGSGLDLKSLYNQIMQMTEKRIMIKGILVALNNGITTFSYEDFKKTNNYSIFAACEAKEAIAQLKMVKTLDPSTKAKKGLKAMPKREVFSSAKIAQLIHEHQLLANKFNSNLEKFNNDTSVEITGIIADKFEKDLAV